MKNKNIWMVRAGERGFLIEDFLNKNIVAIGWNEIGNLANVKDLNEIKNLLRKAYPEYKEGQVNINSGQIYRFRFEFKNGDNVITYNPTQRVYWIGEILSDYEYNKDLVEYHQIRKVGWLGSVLRDKLSTTTKNTLGSTLTIFEIPLNSSNEILNLLSGKTEVVEDSVDKEESLEIIEKDFIAKAHEFIKDKILNLDWEKMQELIAGIIRAMGYKTRISPKGSDRGKDILASPDGLGLEEPRILIEVKHRQGQMGSQEIRSFVGGLRTRDKGLYISTGGFSRDAKYEAERSNIPLTLVDADMLVELIIQYYDEFDSESKALVALRKIYWPI